MKFGEAQPKAPEAGALQDANASYITSGQCVGDTEKKDGDRQPSSLRFDAPGELSYFIRVIRGIRG